VPDSQVSPSPRPRSAPRSGSAARRRT
jgi:hypothetical protein